ncbi:MAG TPA: glycosyltransferase [Luteimonas sp.]
MGADVHLTRPRLSIVLPDLRSGGAERLHVALAQYWRQRGIAVSFILRARRGELLDLLPGDIEVHDLHAPRVRNSIRPLMTHLGSHRPDAVLAAMWPLSVITPVAGRLSGYRGRVVVSEHAPLSLSYAKRGPLHNMLMAASMRACYPLASARVGVSCGVANDMSKLSGISRRNISVINNPAATGRQWPRRQPASPGTDSRPLILSVGTLKPVKRHDLLVRAFARLQMPDARLCIIGEGPERARIEALVSELGLHDRVSLPGYQKEPGPWFSEADLFVLSSDYEGFGNVIVEALEQGTPVVCTDCPSGPREILQDGRFGLLVPPNNVDALAQGLRQALHGQHDRRALKRRALDFSIEKAARAYLSLLLPDWKGRPS